jgi:AraC-like DNA-binding protein
MRSTGTISFPLISFILLMICTICIVNLYLSFKRNGKTLFGRLTNGLTIYLLINASFVWFVECFFVQDPWINRMFPFIFMYGPFYYFYNRVLQGMDLSKLRIFLHSVPFLLAVVTFIVYAYNGWYNDTVKYENFIKYKVGASVTSLVIYWSYGFFNKVSLVGKLIEKRVLLLLGVIMLFVTMFYCAISFFGNVVFNNNESVHLYRVTIYCIMLVIVILIFAYQSLPFLNQNVNEVFEVVPKTIGESMKYEKSYITESQLDVYEGMLNDAVVGKELFLNSELSLSKLSLQSKIPPHHLTQVLNKRLNSNFYSYINYLRIRFACELMIKPDGKEMTIEEIAISSGFNSKVSFNRNFKLFMKNNPSDYRKALV